MKGQPGVHRADSRVWSLGPGMVSGSPLLSSYMCDLEQLLNLSSPWAPAWEMGLLHR